MNTHIPLDKIGPDPDNPRPGAVSPYLEAWRWIEANPGTGSAGSLAKLLLSIWNQENSFSFRECVDNLDDERTDLALRVAIHFANYGEDPELVTIGYKVCEVYPRLYALGEAMTRARRALQEQWRTDDAKEDSREDQ